MSTGQDVTAARSPRFVQLKDDLLYWFTERKRCPAFAHARNLETSQANGNSSSRDVRNRLEQVGSDGANPCDFVLNIRFHERVHVRFHVWRIPAKRLKPFAVPLQPVQGCPQRRHRSKPDGDGLTALGGHNDGQAPFRDCRPLYCSPDDTVDYRCWFVRVHRDYRMCSAGKESGVRAAYSVLFI